MGQDAKLEHRLASIMATDVVGYSRLIQSDEAGTLAALQAAPILGRLIHDDAEASQMLPNVK